MRGCADTPSHRMQRLVITHNTSIRNRMVATTIARVKPNRLLHSKIRRPDTRPLPVYDVSNAQVSSLSELAMSNTYIYMHRRQHCLVRISMVGSIPHQLPEMCGVQECGTEIRDEPWPGTIYTDTRKWSWMGRTMSGAPRSQTLYEQSDHNVICSRARCWLTQRTTLGGGGWLVADDGAGSTTRSSTRTA